MADPVTHAEENGYPIEKWGQGGSLVARRVLRCDWADRYDLLLEVGRNGGQDYPHMPAMGCYAIGATITGFGQSTEASEDPPLNQYPHALLDVFYSTAAPQGAGPRQFVTEEISPTRADRRLEIGQMKWDDGDGRKVMPPEAPQYTHGSVDYVLTFHDLLNLPPGTLFTNRSNAYPVACFLYPLVFPTESLRHLSAITTRTVGLGMSGRYRLQYRWTYHERTWSKFQKSDGEWGEIYHTGKKDILKPYPPVDFNLFYPS